MSSMITSTRPVLRVVSTSCVGISRGGGNFKWQSANAITSKWCYDGSQQLAAFVDLDLPKSACASRVENTFDSASLGAISSSE